MKILLSYATDYDKGEGAHYARVLRRLGHDVCELNLASRGRASTALGRTIQGYPPYVTIQTLLRDHPDASLYLYIEPLGLIPRGLAASPIPTACVLCDVHRNLGTRQAVAKLFDHVFLYHKNYLMQFGDHPQGAVHWLPYACDTEFFCDLGRVRDLDIAFIGQLSNPLSERHRVINSIAKRYRMNEQRYYLQREIPEVYSRARIVINLPLGDDLNFRFFEALSCGALLLTKRVANGQEELFREGVHFAAFGNEGELCEKIEHYLNAEKERKTIAEAGHQEVIKHHTLALRLETLLERVRSGPQFAAPVRRMGRVSMAKLQMYARHYVKGLVDRPPA